MHRLNNTEGKAKQTTQKEVHRLQTLHVIGQWFVVCLVLIPSFFYPSSRTIILQSTSRYTTYGKEPNRALGPPRDYHSTPGNLQTRT